MLAGYVTFTPGDWYFTDVTIRSSCCALIATLRALMRWLELKSLQLAVVVICLSAPPPPPALFRALLFLSCPFLFYFFLF